VEVKRPDGYAVTFAYDALGRRVSKRFRGRVTRWVWDGDQPLHEWAELVVEPGAGSVAELTTWLFEEGSFIPVAKLTGQGAQSVVSDHLGTPLALYDGRGQVTWEMALDSYGAVRQGKGKAQDCPFRYQGQYEDVETGLYYNRFRYYDPQTGGYISQDPIRLGGSTLNL
jgi:RHS repeat-associated protein